MGLGGACECGSSYAGLALVNSWPVGGREDPSSGGGCCGSWVADEGEEERCGGSSSSSSQRFRRLAGGFFFCRPLFTLGSFTQSSSSQSDRPPRTIGVESGLELLPDLGEALVPANQEALRPQRSVRERDCRDNLRSQSHVSVGPWQRLIGAHTPPAHPICQAGVHGRGSRTLRWLRT